MSNITQPIYTCEKCIVEDINLEAVCTCCNVCVYYSIMYVKAFAGVLRNFCMFCVN